MSQTPPSPSDDAAWDLLALKLALLSPRWYGKYSKARPSKYVGFAGLRALGLERDIDLGVLLIRACKRINQGD